MSDKKKVGRPIKDALKNVKLTVRIDEESAEVLDSYCNRRGVSKADGVRDGIKALKDK